jgi:hypothetical protein
MKKCSDCKQIKSLELFSKNKSQKDGHTNICRLCLKDRYLLNKDLCNTRSKNYYKKNKENILIRHKKNINNKLKTQPIFKFSHNVRSLIRGSFKRGVNQYKKSAKTESILCCTIEEFKIYIESKFTEGMNFNNYGKWHLDHIKPVSLATSEDDIIKLNHYTNFQPLWAEENISKGNKF